MSFNKNKSLSIILFLCTFCVAGCRKYLDTEVSKSQIVEEKVFNSDMSAVSAMTGVYHTMVSSSFAGGGNFGIPALTGLSSDEMYNYLNQDLSSRQFETNELRADNLQIADFWREAYQIISFANNMIENLDRSTEINSNLKQQLKGESLFIRAYCYFYLVNMYGEVPLILNTDYKQNATKARMGVNKIYQQILDDLLNAKSLLPLSYDGAERIRANKAAATAMLARVYLYNNEWQKSIEESTQVINDQKFSLVADLSQVFQKGSIETIWQLASDPPINTKDAQSFVIVYGPGNNSLVLRQGLLNEFEAGDKRKENWIGLYSDIGDNLFFANKYKVWDFDQPISEHFVVLRLAEQYLVRAEALLHLGSKDAAIADLDKIRGRAGIPLVSVVNPSISESELFSLIEKERRLELFAEGGHRWFDLKRSEKARFVLTSIKPLWTDDDKLYPIPQSEFNKNPNLGNQNPNY